jgi:hypothetical protein
VDEKIEAGQYANNECKDQGDIPASRSDA